MNNLASEITQSLEFISREGAFSVSAKGSRRKWDGEWWHLVTLCEMGLADRVPASAARKALDQLKYGAWPKFVINKEDAPQTDADRHKMDCWHCELGVYYTALYQCGCDVEEKLPWIRKWVLKHQLPDGGLNCTPSAYRRSGKSSVVSTLPPLEAILFCTDRPYPKAEAEFLDEGARYLIQHHLIRSKGTGEIINSEWLKPLFPRFFEYDLLRGLHFLASWAQFRCKPLPTEIIGDALKHLEARIDSSKIKLGRHINDSNSDWQGKTFGSSSKDGDMRPRGHHVPDDD